MGYCIVIHPRRSSYLFDDEWFQNSGRVLNAQNERLETEQRRVISDLTPGITDLRSVSIQTRLVVDTQKSARVRQQNTRQACFHAEQTEALPTF